MSYIAYEFTLTQALDAGVVNSVSDMTHLAWQIGRDERRQKSLWLIEPLFPEVEGDSTSVLPAEYVPILLLDDVTRYGYNRSIFPNLSISDLLIRFEQTRLKMREVFS